MSYVVGSEGSGVEVDRRAKRLQRAKVNEYIGWAVLYIMALSACVFISGQLLGKGQDMPAGGDHWVAEGESPQSVDTAVASRRGS